MKKNYFRFLIGVMFLVFSLFGNSQELYVFSEPASNMPAKSVGLKYSKKSIKETVLGHSHTSNRHMLETQFGLSKKFAVHPSITVSDMYTYQKMKFESVGLNLKYRFLSLDEVHKHFRVAYFLKGVISSNNLRYEELTTEGDQTAIETGFIFTQLIHKLAISATVGINEVMDEERWAKVAGPKNYGFQNFNYSLSAGYLLFPRKYTSFNQPNFNIYCELLGARGLDRPVSYVDLAPAVQVIVRSNTKINFGYRFQIAGEMNRMATSGFVFSFEKTFLNALKKRNL
jgi:hypothetical protein